MKGKAILIGKNKYIMAAIALILVLAVGVSFCVWDTTSIDKLLTGGKTADYSRNYTMGVDTGTIGKPDLGDTIFYGNYYQSANEVTKSPVEWRVVDFRTENGKEIMYLLSERIHAFGNYSGTGYYFDDAGLSINIPENISGKYDESTISAWLNSEIRIDKGYGFGNATSDDHVVFNGFYKEAFSKIEKESIVARNLPGTVVAGVPQPTAVERKVWIPSITELYGRVDIVDAISGTKFNLDNPQDTQLAYYIGKSNVYYQPKTTLFATAWTSKNGLIANYSMKNLMHSNNINATLNSESNAVWWTRSNGIQYANRAVMCVETTGDIPIGYHGPQANSLGVRPAICLER